MSGQQTLTIVIVVTIIVVVLIVLHSRKRGHTHHHPTGPTTANALLVGQTVIPIRGTGNAGDILTLNANQTASFQPLGITPAPPDVDGGSASSNQMVYVRKGGSDVTGDGTLSAPYLTITHAMSTITDALWEKRYLIDVGPGNWADNFSWKAWVFMKGAFVQNTRLTGVIDINDPSWAVPGTHSDERSGAQDVSFTGTMTLDYAGISSSYGKFYYFNCNMNNTLVINGFNPINQCIVEGGFWFGGITSVGCAITWNGVSGQGGTITLNSSPTASSFTGFGGGTVGNLAVNFTTGIAPVATLIDCPILGSLTISGSGASVDATNSSLPVKSNITISGGGILNRLTDAFSLAYSAASLANWNGVSPSNVSAALDRIAAKIGPIL
jgi:hypothetical protein